MPETSQDDVQFSNSKKAGAPARSCPLAPPPAEDCWVYKIRLTETRPKEKEEKPKPAKAYTGKDANTLEQEIFKKENEIQKEQAVLDRSVNNPTQSQKSRQTIQRLEFEIAALKTQRSEALAAEAQANNTGDDPDERVFEVFAVQPRSYVTELEKGIAALKKLRKEYEDLLENWTEAFGKHEAAKKTLQDFSKTKKTLADARDSARVKYEQVKAAKKVCENAKLAEDAKKRELQRKGQTGSRWDRFTEKVKKAVGWDADTRLEEMEQKLQEAFQDYDTKFKAYQNYVTNAYQQAREAERSTSQALYAAQDKLKKKADEIATAEKKNLKARNARARQMDKNPLELDGNVIQMTADTEGEKDAKSPTIKIEVDPDQAPDNWGPAKACTRKHPLIHLGPSGGKRPHPHLIITDSDLPNPNVLKNFAPAVTSDFQIWQASQAMKIKGHDVPLTAALRSVFSNNPVLREYVVTAMGCGYERSGKTRSAVVDAVIQVYPGEAWSLAYKCPSWKGLSIEKAGGVDKGEKASGNVETKKKTFDEDDDDGSDDSDDSSDDSDSSGGDSGGGSDPDVPPDLSDWMPDKDSPVPILFVLQRNGEDGPSTDDLKSAAQWAIWVVRGFAGAASWFSKALPTYGFSMGFEASALEGSVSYTKQWRELSDARVWLHRKVSLDIDLITARVFFKGGVGVDWTVLVVEAVVELWVKGSIGFEASCETLAPDSDQRAQLGVGLTGAVGVGGEARIIIGKPEWFEVSGSVEAGMEAEGTWWIMHEEGVHLDASLNWKGFTVKGVIHIIGVCDVEKTATFSKERELWSGEWPRTLENNVVAAQKKSMIEARKEAQKDMKQLVAKVAKAKQR